MNHRLPAHHFGSVGAGVNMTVVAGLVTELAHVHLENLDSSRPQGMESDTLERVIEPGDMGVPRLDDLELYQGNGQLMFGGFERLHYGVDGRQRPSSPVGLSEMLALKQLPGSGG